MGAALMKPDAEGEYVAGIIRGQKETPRPLPKGSLRKLFFLSPNSRYDIFVALVCLGFLGLFFYVRLHPSRYATVETSTVLMVAAVIPIMIALVMPLDYALRIRRAVQVGI